MPNKKSKAKSTQQNPVSCLSLQHPNLLIDDLLVLAEQSVAHTAERTSACLYMCSVAWSPFVV